LRLSADAASDFRALTHYPERVADRTAYLMLFPIGTDMRANLFVYRDMHDPWVQPKRHAPLDALSTLMPRLRRLAGDVEVAHVKIQAGRSVLEHRLPPCRDRARRRRFASSCVERLSNHQVPGRRRAPAGTPEHHRAVAQAHGYQRSASVVQPEAVTSNAP